MKSISFFLLLLFPFLSSAQQSNANTYFGFGLYNIGEIKLNNTLETNNLNKINSSAIEFNYGFHYCKKQFGFFADGFMAINNVNKNSLLLQGFRVGPTYTPLQGEKYNLKLSAYYRFMHYGAHVTNKENLSTSNADLANSNGGILLFNTFSSAIGGAVWLSWERFTLKIGGEASLAESKWRLQNNTIAGFSSETFSQVYVGIAYNFIK